MRILICILLLVSTLHARDIFVDPAGNDKADGSQAAPLRTLARAVAATRAGDRVQLAAGKVFSESLILKNVRGEEGKPLVIEGNGAVLNGADPLEAAQWQAAGEGLFKSEALYRHVQRQSGAALRWFFLFDGKPQHMGRTSKGAKAPFKSIDKLAPGEWTVADEAFYIRLPANQTLADARVAAPIRTSGVPISGDRAAHLLIRNLKVRHFYNDGFNIHGQCRAVRFEHIEAVECGDDGFSAHEQCEVEVEGLVARGNSTGVCNVNQVRCVIRGLELTDNLAYDYGALHDSFNRVIGGAIRNQAAVPLLMVGSPTPGKATLELQDVTLEGTGPTPARLLVRPHASFKSTGGQERNVVRVQPTK